MKPRKRYNPRKHRAYSGTGILPHILVKAAVSKKAIPQEEINGITAGYRRAVEAIGNGTCTDGLFWSLIENHYLYIHLTAVLRQAGKYSDNPQTDMLARLEIIAAYDEAESIMDVIQSISERKQRQGRFGATGEELTRLKTGLARFTALLGIANYAHYMQAFKNSEPVISDIAYRHNKRIKQEQAK